MTTYTAILGSEIDTDSPVTESLMTRIRDNPIAITEGSAGAPKIQNAAIATDAVRAAQIQANAVGASEIATSAVGASEIAAGAVHTSELNTATGSASTANQYYAFTMTGGMYTFAPQLRSSSAVNDVYLYGGWDGTVWPNPSTSSTSFVTAMAIGRSGVGTAYAQWRYVAASPPHDMGDGDIPAFIYAVIDNTTQDIESIAFAEDPVWLANGPTNATPNHKVDGVGVIKTKDFPVDWEQMPIPAKRVLLDVLPDKFITITEELKHADMDIIPHPFQGNDLTGKTVVMLDPVSDAVRELWEFEKVGEDIHAIIRDGYIKIGNEPLPRVTPAGLLIPSTAWK